MNIKSMGISNGRMTDSCGSTSVTEILVSPSAKIRTVKEGGWREDDTAFSKANPLNNSHWLSTATRPSVERRLYETLFSFFFFLIFPRRLSTKSVETASTIFPLFPVPLPLVHHAFSFSRVSSARWYRPRPKNYPPSSASPLNPLTPNVPAGSGSRGTVYVICL